MKLSLLMIVKNGGELFKKSLQSTRDMVDEIVIVDNGSTDDSVKIAEKFGAKVYKNLEKDLGKLRKYGFEQAKGDWILMLDTDEIVSDKLKNEIKQILDMNSSNLTRMTYNGFLIPYINHFLGKPLKHGGENYKILRLFKKDSVKINAALLHEKFEIIKGQVGELKNPILHYSYRSIPQVYKKFTDYAIRDARQRIERGEKTSLKKIFMYPLHMLWARYVEDKGYKDGIFRIPLDLAFAYMEWLTYTAMLFMKKRSI